MNDDLFCHQGCSTGECETWYHISEMSEEYLNAEPDLLPVPELCENLPVYEIVKNRDLDKCRILPHFYYNNVEGLRCNGVHGAGCENKVSVISNLQVPSGGTLTLLIRKFSIFSTST